ncbi:hypothetical protein GCM10023259_024090 [Thermocatellispora tengchongensis]
MIVGAAAGAPRPAPVAVAVTVTAKRCEPEVTARTAVKARTTINPPRHNKKAGKQPEARS